MNSRVSDGGDEKTGVDPPNAGDDVGEGESSDKVSIEEMQDRNGEERTSAGEDNVRSRGEGLPPDKREHRQWIHDRVKGGSRVGDDHPPLRCCTVPPCVSCCPGVLEQNCLCENIGRMGVVNSNDRFARKWLMRIGFGTQFVGMLLTAVSCFAISTNYEILSTLGFTRGIITATNQTYPTEISIGLRAVAINNPNPGKVGEIVVTFDEFCTLTPKSSRDQVTEKMRFDIKALSDYLDPKNCGECAAVSQSMVVSLFLSVVTYLPTLFTDILRMYPNYDVNCQKAFGFIFAFFGLGMSINTWLKYHNHCVNSFYEGEVPHDAQGAVLMKARAHEAASWLDFDWTEGAALICLIVATFLKIVDIVCHFLLPTPSITRDHTEQAEYEELTRKEETTGPVQDEEV